MLTLLYAALFVFVNFCAAQIFRLTLKLRGNRWTRDDAWFLLVPGIGIATVILFVVAVALIFLARSVRWVIWLTGKYFEEFDERD